MMVRRSFIHGVCYVLMCIVSSFIRVCFHVSIMAGEAWPEATVVSIRKQA